MPLTGRIFLVLFAMVLTLGLVLDHPRSFAVRPPSHLAESASIESAAVPSP